MGDYKFVRPVMDGFSNGYTAGVELKGDNTAAQASVG